MEKPITEIISLKKVIVALVALLLIEDHLVRCSFIHAAEPSLWMSDGDSSSSEVKVSVKSDGCSGSMGEGCVWEAEMEMDSEINRRVLMAQKRYISYGSLQKDQVPCSTPGAPYYNCRSHGRGVGYSRGCEVITGCGRDTHF
ncbi:rapid alkalinization factor-like [Aristolochia californica]|uniref:rapid alkalinization factor-like n=1 Tax=Aristolochia californica TaxID=171875 RepID=UPI0035D93642